MRVESTSPVAVPTDVWPDAGRAVAVNSDRLPEEQGNAGSAERLATAEVPSSLVAARVKDPLWVAPGAGRPTQREIGGIADATHSAIESGLTVSTGFVYRLNRVRLV